MAETWRRSVVEFFRIARCFGLAAGRFLLRVIGMVEPLVYGHSTSLSAVAIVVAAAFLTWPGDPSGCFYQRPLRYALSFWDAMSIGWNSSILFSAISPWRHPRRIFIQRMLADDAAEAAQQAER